MTKSELIARLVERFPLFPAADVVLTVNAILDGLSQQLVRGDRIELRGFGSFQLNFRPPRTARNPKTGVPVKVEGKWVPHFKAGKELREAIMRAAEAEANGVRRVA